MAAVDRPWPEATQAASLSTYITAWLIQVSGHAGLIFSHCCRLRTQSSVDRRHTRYLCVLKLLPDQYNCVWAHWIYTNTATGLARPGPWLKYWYRPVFVTINTGTSRKSPTGTPINSHKNGWQRLLGELGVWLGISSQNCISYHLRTCGGRGVQGRLFLKYATRLLLRSNAVSLY